MLRPSGAGRRLRGPKKSWSPIGMLPMNPAHEIRLQRGGIAGCGHRPSQLGLSRQHRCVHPAPQRTPSLNGLPMPAETDVKVHDWGFAEP